MSEPLVHAKACRWRNGEEDTHIRGGGGMDAEACHWPNGEWGSTRCQMLGRERPDAVLPERTLYLPTFSHLLIVDLQSLVDCRCLRLGSARCSGPGVRIQKYYQLNTALLQKIRDR